MKLTYRSISEIGSQEKYIRANHYNSLKTWWARRPITTMRALLIDEMLKREDKKDHEIDADLLQVINPSNEIFQKFSQQYCTNQKTVLDVFAGGGSIPFESSRLGFKTYSSELNPVASLLQETIFESGSVSNFSDKLRHHGSRIIDRMETRMKKYFSIGDQEFYVLFLSKVAKCKNCSHDLDLRRLEYLSKRVNKPVRLVNDKLGLKLVLNANSVESLQKEFSCLNCGEKNGFKDIRDFCLNDTLSHKPFAYCYSSKGKKYKVIDDNDLKVLANYEAQIKNDIKSLENYIPYEIVKSKGGVINPTLYDLKQHKDFFSSRQLLVLLTLIDEISVEYSGMSEDTPSSEKKQIVLGLTSLIEFLVDWNSVSTMWISQNEQTGRSLAGPGVGMKWDFIEINPFYSEGSNLRSKLNRVCSTYEAIKLNSEINILKGSSTDLVLPDESIDIILTDPPYYDSIDYTGLSEFFRPWFEVVIRSTFDINIDLKNDDGSEAIVELTGNKLKGHDHYQHIMTGVLTECNRVMKNDGSCLLMYSHKTIEGWQVISEAFLKAGLIITECIALDMERSARPRGMAYEALNGVIVFRASKNPKDVSTISEDIIDLHLKIQAGNMYESQVIIYLAGLACKLVTNSRDDFKKCYQIVTDEYNLKNINLWLKNDFDDLTIAYLEARITQDLDKLTDESKNLLILNGLVSMNKTLHLDQIKTIENRISILGQALELYNEFMYNSKTKVIVVEEKYKCFIAFFSILAGTQLNTVKKRTSEMEIKTSRLILSKLSHL
jgi:putative DNA methylase